MNTSTVTPRTAVQLAKAVTCRRIGDVFFVFDPISGGFYSLDAVAADFWQHIVRSSPIDQACAELCETYDGAQQQICGDLVEFVEFFHREGIFTLLPSD